MLARTNRFKPAVDESIDKLVASRELYGLSKEEIKTVEGMEKK